MASDSSGLVVNESDGTVTVRALLTRTASLCRSDTRYGSTEFAPLEHLLRVQHHRTFRLEVGVHVRPQNARISVCTRHS